LLPAGRQQPPRFDLSVGRALAERRLGSSNKVLPINEPSNIEFGLTAMSPQTRFAKLTEDAKSRIREVSPIEASQQQAQGALLIDIREGEEYANGHARGAFHLSRGVLELRIEGLVPDASTPLLCYCGGGSRSALAADSLQRMGYTNVASIAGGFKAWREAGLPTE
jgi:rhodanese-related sulfurtransferase